MDLFSTIEKMSVLGKWKNSYATLGPGVAQSMKKIRKSSPVQNLLTGIKLKEEGGSPWQMLQLHFNQLPMSPFMHSNLGRKENILKPTNSFDWEACVFRKLKQVIEVKSVKDFIEIKLAKNTLIIGVSS